MAPPYPEPWHPGVELFGLSPIPPSPLEAGEIEPDHRPITQSGSPEYDTCRVAEIGLAARTTIKFLRITSDDPERSSGTIGPKSAGDAFMFLQTGAILIVENVCHRIPKEPVR